MTAASFAELVNARRTGAGKWQARCPAHPDRSPSLSIAEGRSGILLRCWSHGCTPEQIVMVLGLSMRDLFDAPLTPASRRELELRQAKQALETSRKRRKRIALMKCYRACTRRMAEIADSFFNDQPEKPDELGREYHDCLDFQRAVEVEVFG